MRFGDPCVFPQLQFPIDKALSNSRSDNLSIPFTSDAAEILTIILERLAGFPAPQNAALLFSGDPGVDTSQLLHYLEKLLSDPDHPAWNTLLQCLHLAEKAQPNKPIQSLFVQIPLNASINLEAFLRDAFQWDSLDAFQLLSQEEMEPGEFLLFAQQISARMTDQSLGMVVLENISHRIEQLTDLEKVKEEQRLLRILSESLSRSGILTILLGAQKHLNPKTQTSLLLNDEEVFSSKYSWMEFADISPRSRSESHTRQEDSFNEQFQLLIYDWVQHKIPSWQPDRGPRYRRDSQALEAVIPENEEAPAGLVYFKSIFDPHWSDEDLAGLRENAAWILMILNPCERFGDFESRYRDMCSRLPILLIWRPAAPSKTEMESLVGLAHETSEKAAEDGIPKEETIKRIHTILEDLYIRRGQLIGFSDQHSVCDRIGSQGISRYLSDCLNRLPLSRSDLSRQQASLSAKAEQEKVALDWALLLTGNAELAKSHPDQVKKALVGWWTNSAEGLEKKLPDIPETLRNIRFWSKIKGFESPLLALKPVFSSLHSGAFTFFEAMDHVVRNFSGDRERLQEWTRQIGNLENLMLWLPAFMNACDYVNAALPLDHSNLDHIRSSLLQSIEDSSRFLEAKARDEFEMRFLEFKRNYVNTYCLLHEDAVYAKNNLKKKEAKIDPISLRNLELLSGLLYADKSYLNRVKLLAKWMKRHQCNLPVRQILEHYPRCYCNFNPHSNRQPATLNEQINCITQEGVDFFCTVLRKCGHVIIKEIGTQLVEDSNLMQITSILGDARLIPLKPQCIHILNGIIARHPNEYRAEIRKAAKRNRRIH